MSPPKYCVDCKHARVHGTGSLLWLSCDLRGGWFSMDAICSIKHTQTINSSDLHTIKRTVNDNEKIQNHQRNARILEKRTAKV